MKRGVVALVAVGLALTGCASQTTLPESEYFDLVREHDGFDALGDDVIREVGVIFCEEIEKNEDGYLTSLKFAIDNGIDAGDAGAIISFSVAQYCPQHIERIPTR